MIPQEILNLGAVSILFFLFLKEFFAYLKVRKNGNGTYRKDMAAVNLKLANHLTDFNKEMGKMVERVGSIEGGMIEMKMDVKIVKNAMNDIKIRLK